MKVSKQNAPHYLWGDQCEGWKLIDRTDQSIIHEKMPPFTQESRHYHQHARQFFFILHGEAVMEIEGTETTLSAHEGIEIAPGLTHQIFNRSQEPVEFLVMSAPSTRGDRVEQ